jgi:CBS domain-containing protein
MTPWPTTIEPELEIRQAAQEMLYLNVPRLFVEFDGALVGVISQTDIVGAVATARV